MITELLLYSKLECSLCDKVKEQLQSLKDIFKFEYQTIYIDRDPELVHRYSARVPVLVAGNKEICELGFDRNAVCSYLQENSITSRSHDY